MKFNQSASSEKKNFASPKRKITNISHTNFLLRSLKTQENAFTFIYFLTNALLFQQSYLLSFFWCHWISLVMKCTKYKTLLQLKKKKRSHITRLVRKETAAFAMRWKLTQFYTGMYRLLKEPNIKLFITNIQNKVALMFPSTSFSRCGHMCACLKCANDLRWNNGKCPICRANIDDVVRVYLDV